MAGISVYRHNRAAALFSIDHFGQVGLSLSIDRFDQKALKSISSVFQAGWT